MVRGLVVNDPKATIGDKPEKLIQVLLPIEGLVTSKFHKMHIKQVPVADRLRPD